MNNDELLKYTDMTKEQLQECIQRLDINIFLKDPTKALVDAGIILKEGISFKFVDTEEEAKALPANQIPLIRTQYPNEALSIENLDKVAGGIEFSTGYYRARLQGSDAAAAYEASYGRYDEKKKV